MPLVNIPVQTTSRTGLEVQLGAAAEITGDPTNNHKVRNHGDETIQVRNAGAVQRTVTFVTAGTADGNAVADPAAALEAGEVMLFSGFVESVYNASDGYMQINVDSADLRLIAFRGAGGGA